MSATSSASGRVRSHARSSSSGARRARIRSITSSQPEPQKRRRIERAGVYSRMIRTLLLSVLLLAGCPKSDKPPGDTTRPEAVPAPDDSAVVEGAGWIRTAPGAWTYDLVSDERPDESLRAEPGGHGLQRID